MEANEKKTPKSHGSHAKFLEDGGEKFSDEYWSKFQRNATEMKTHLEETVYKVHGRWKGENLLTAYGYKGDPYNVVVWPPQMHNYGWFGGMGARLMQECMQGEHNKAMRQKLGGLHKQMSQMSVSKQHGRFKSSLSQTRKLVRDLAIMEMPFRQVGDPSIRHLGLIGVFASLHFQLVYTMYEYSPKKAFQLRVISALGIECLRNASSARGEVKFKRKGPCGQTSRNHVRVVYTPDMLLSPRGVACPDG
mgnify:CR=1 FL=1